MKDLIDWKISRKIYQFVELIRKFDQFFELMQCLFRGDVCPRNMSYISGLFSGVKITWKSKMFSLMKLSKCVLLT